MGCRSSVKRRAALSCTLQIKTTPPCKAPEVSIFRPLAPKPAMDLTKPLGDGPMVLEIGGGEGATAPL